MSPPHTTTATETGIEACYTALVIPGKATNFKLFSVNVGGKEVEFTTDIDFEENHVYEYTLTIGKDRVVLDALNVKEWETSTLTGTMTKEWSGEEAQNFEGGSGTEEDPYQIANSAQLFMLANNVSEYDSNNKYYVLTRDINLAGANWTSIGLKEERAFYGHFDGAGHSIKNMKINQSELTTEYEDRPCGLFYQLIDCSVRNLTIEGAEIIVVNSANLSSIGILAGQINTVETCVIDNCHIKNAKISYASENRDYSPYIGGIAGKALGSVSISRCTVDNLTTPTALTQAYTGGILGVVVAGGNVQVFASSVTNSELYGCYTCGLVSYCASSLTVSGAYCYNCTLQSNDYRYWITYFNNAGNSDISYFAGNQWLYPYCNNSKFTTTGCNNGATISEFHGIVANPSNEKSFTLDGTKYKVSECWQNNGNALPTLKVSKDGRQQDN